MSYLEEKDTLRIHNSQLLIDKSVGAEPMAIRMALKDRSHGIAVIPAELN
jgi:hypothetical protein